MPAASLPRLVARSPAEILDEIRDDVAELEVALSDASPSDELARRLCRAAWAAVRLEDVVAIARIRLEHPRFSAQLARKLSRSLRETQAIDRGRALELARSGE